MRVSDEVELVECEIELREVKRTLAAYEDALADRPYLLRIRGLLEQEITLLRLMRRTRSP